MTASNADKLKAGHATRLEGVRISVLSELNFPAMSFRDYSQATTLSFTPDGDYFGLAIGNGGLRVISWTHMRF